MASTIPTTATHTRNAEGVNLMPDPTQTTAADLSLWCYMHPQDAAKEIERLRRYAQTADAWLASENQLGPFRRHCEAEGIEIHGQPI
jgi:hypothetical protein